MYLNKESQRIFQRIDSSPYRCQPYSESEKRGLSFRLYLCNGMPYLTPFFPNSLVYSFIHSALALGQIHDFIANFASA